MSNHTGTFHLDSSSAKDYHFTLLAAGTGFTPMARLLRRALDLGAGSVKLVFFNKTERDIIWRDQLDEMEQKEKRLSVTHVLSAQDDWTGEKGRVSRDLLGRLLKKQKNKFAGICGPNAFNDSAKKILLDLGFKEEEVFLFQG